MTRDFPRPAPESIDGRSRACELAVTDPPRALRIARSIPDAWYRCQALTEIAQHASAERFEPLFLEAVIAAQAAPDVYQTVAVMGWPLMAAIDRGRADLAERELAGVLARVPSVTPMASRAYALELLWRSCFAGGRPFRGPIWRTIAAHVHPDRSWRAARLYRLIARDLGPGGRARVIAAMPDGKARRKIERGVARRQMP
jgi:hypothetical protein